MVDDVDIVSRHRQMTHDVTPGGVGRGDHGRGRPQARLDPSLVEAEERAGAEVGPHLGDGVVDCDDTRDLSDEGACEERRVVEVDVPGGELRGHTQLFPRDAWILNRDLRHVWRPIRQGGGTLGVGEVHIAVRTAETRGTGHEIPSVRADPGHFWGQRQGIDGDSHACLQGCSNCAACVPWAETEGNKAPGR